MKLLILVPALAVTMLYGCGQGDDYAPSAPSTQTQSRMTPSAQGPSGTRAAAPAARGADGPRN